LFTSAKSNILEDYLSFEESLSIEKGLLFRENVLIYEVSEEDYLKAVSVAEDKRVGVNDALAYVLMKKVGIQKIYSFVKDFDAFSDVDRVVK
jgi:predicted nucleic acid-binding protein